MTEALAGEVAPFGIKVTASRPGPCEQLSSSLQGAPSMAEYDVVRDVPMQCSNPMAGSPLATAAVILRLVDSSVPSPITRTKLGGEALRVTVTDDNQPSSSW